MKKSKKILIIIVILIGILIGGLICREIKIQNRISQYPCLEDESSLREAMAGEPKVYQIYNAPLTGLVYKDKLGILDETYLAFYYEEETYARAVYERHYSWNVTHEEKYQSKNLNIYGDIELQIEDYKIDTIAVGIDEIKDAYKDNMEQDLFYYYPEGIGDNCDNVRYEMYGVPMGCKVAFLALVGDNKVTPINLIEGNTPKIFISNHIDY